MKRRKDHASAAVRARAKELRKLQTPAECTLWNGLRGWALGKWRRQHPYRRFILDFYCPALRLCVEVDGSSHDDPDQRVMDRARTEELATCGIRVVRFSNAEVLEDPRRVLRQIEREMRRITPPS